MIRKSSNGKLLGNVFHALIAVNVLMHRKGFLIYSPCCVAAAQRQKRQVRKRETLCFAQRVMVAVSVSVWGNSAGALTLKEAPSQRTLLGAIRAMIHLMSTEIQ